MDKLEMWQPFIFNFLFVGIGVILNESKMKSRFRVANTVAISTKKKLERTMCFCGNRRKKE